MLCMVKNEVSSRTLWGNPLHLSLTCVGLHGARLFEIHIFLQVVNCLFVGHFELHYAVNFDRYEDGRLPSGSNFYKLELGGKLISEC